MAEERLVVERLHDRLGLGVGRGIERLPRMAVPPEETLQTEHVAVLGMTHDDWAAGT